MKGNAFKKTIKAIGMNQVVTARFLGVSIRTVQRVAAGTRELERAPALLLLVMEHWNLKPAHVDPTWKERT